MTGRHAHVDPPTPDTEHVPQAPPRAVVGPLTCDPSPLLRVLEPIHAERLDAFRALQGALADAREVAAVIVDQDGFPMLHVIRVDATRSLPVGCVYQDRAWWFATPDIAQWARTCDVEAAAAEIRRALA